ncbi:hypothetical protein [Spirosoma sp.]|uniref:hypothetical protein n=1 Tax=Spirosoma sp. TaxID=1899569 RepID=UPI003B3A92A8
MKHTRAQYARSWLLTGLIVSSSLTLWNCSGDKKESTTETSETASDSSVFGRQGDTTNNSMDAPQQAPPDSASAGGAVVPAEVKVKPKE